MTWPPTSEIEVCKIVIDVLEDAGFEVYKEVEFYGQRADLVGTKPGRTVIVEVKTRLGLDGLAQAEFWVKREAANQVWFVVPEAKRKKTMRSRSWNFAEQICEWRGIGLGVIQKRGYYYRRGRLQYRSLDDVEAELGVISRPKMIWNPSNSIRSVLLPQHKTMGVAGGNGGHVTQFRLTCIEIRKYVEAHPGCTIRDAVGAVDHHYASKSSAVGSLRERGSRGVIDGVETRFESGRWRFYPTS